MSDTQSILKQYNDLKKWYITSSDAIYLLRLMYELTPQGFEQYIATYFNNVFGYTTKRIGGYNDHWIDVKWYKKLNKSFKHLFIQCKKRYGDPVKKKEILDFDDNVSRIKSKITGSIIKCFATTTRITRFSKQVAEEKWIKLIDRYILLKMKPRYSLDDFEIQTGLRKNRDKYFTHRNIQKTLAYTLHNL